MAVGQSRPESGQADHASNEPLLANGPSHFELENRPRRDVPWLIAYGVVMVTTILGGVIAFAKRNPRFQELTSLLAVNNPDLCPIASTRSARLLLQSDIPYSDNSTKTDAVFSAVIFWISMSAVGAVILGVLFLWLVRTTPRGLVMAALSVPVIMLGAWSISWLVMGQPVAALVPLAVGAIMVLGYYFWRSQIELVIELLGLAGRGIADNPGLVLLALGLQVGLVAVLKLPLLMAAGAAYMNGVLAYNPQRVDGGNVVISKLCMDGTGTLVPCCIWKTDGWVPAFLALAGIAITWSIFLAFQIKLYTAAGTMAQWYFGSRAGALEMASLCEDGAGRSVAYTAVPSGPSDATIAALPRRSRALTALRFAAGPSLGTLCAASAVLTVLSFIRRLIERVRDRARPDLACNPLTAFFYTFLAGCLTIVLSLMEFITGFTTVYAAITGQAFFTAGANVVALLRRNALNAYGVWWLPPMILQLCSFVLTCSWAVAVGFISYRATWADERVTDAGDGVILAFAMGIVALIASAEVLSFLVSLINDSIDALFICYAMDRDAGRETVPEVHVVMAKLPRAGAVVQQPDGSMAYGAPPEQQQQLQQQQPGSGYQPPAQQDTRRGGNSLGLGLGSLGFGQGPARGTFAPLPTGP